MTERNVGGASPGYHTRSPQRNRRRSMVGGRGWFHAWLHPSPGPPSGFPETSLRGAEAAEPPGRCLPCPSEHHSRPPCPLRDLKLGKSHQTAREGSVQNTGFSIPRPALRFPRPAEAERGGRRARLGWGSCGREAPLPPTPRFVPSTFALPNFIVEKYLLKIRRFVNFFLQ